MRNTQNSYSHRVQLMLAGDQYGLVRELASAHNKSVSELLREVSIAALVRLKQKEEKSQALSTLRALSLPTTHWRQEKKNWMAMKSKIGEGKARSKGLK